MGSLHCCHASSSMVIIFIAQHLKFTMQNCERWQRLSAKSCQLVWHFFENFYNNRNPCLIRVYIKVGVFVTMICQLVGMGK